MVVLALALALWPLLTDASVRVTDIMQGPRVAPVELKVTPLTPLKLETLVGPIVSGLAGPLLGVTVVENVPPQVELKVNVHQTDVGT